MTGIRRDATTFNNYVNPGINKKFSDAASAVHGLYYQDPRILSAAIMPSMWSDFCTWITGTTYPVEVVMLVAYNGATYDLKWIWKLTQTPNYPYLIPDVTEFFLKPLRVINKYKGCKLNPTKSKLDSLEFGAVRKYIKGGENINGAHDSFVDAMAQTDILVHKSFTLYIDRGLSIQLIHGIFSKTQQAVWNK